MATPPRNRPLNKRWLGYQHPLNTQTAEATTKAAAIKAAAAAATQSRAAKQNNAAIDLTTAKRNRTAATTDLTTQTQPPAAQMSRVGPERPSVMKRAIASGDITPSGKKGPAQPLDKLVEDPRSAPFHLCQPGTHPDDYPLVEGLRMSSSPETPFRHQPVMLDEVVELLRHAPAGIYVDGTLGGAGHASAVLDANSNLALVGIDRDQAAVTKAREVLSRFGDRAKVVRGTFDTMADAVASCFPGMPVTAVLLDLGVSSPQLDVAERGFSFRNDGPIDMRMDSDSLLSARDVVNEYSVGELERVLRDGGETRFASRIARAIVSGRPHHSTAQLAEVVRTALPAFARRRPGDPARRTFQAIRIEVNGELQLLDTTMSASLDLLAPGGRCVVLSYHSGEDAMVKSHFRDVATRNCACPPQLPCMCGSEPRARLLTRKSGRPTRAEIDANPRAESARLRAIQMLEGNESKETDQ